MIREVIHDCARCPNLVQNRTQIVYATPCKKGGLLAIGEAPGRDEDLQGEGFVGIAGKTLDRLLAVHNISRNDYGRANICRCRPPENRKPAPEEVSNCLPFLEQLIIERQPKVILAIGSTPTAVFCGKGTLYSIINEGRVRNDWAAKHYNSVSHPKIANALSSVGYIIPSPHTSPLAFNRNSPSGEKWAIVAAKQLEIAVNLLTRA